ncbi:DUF2059 domain-containing protein [Verrucomicrobiaceae bacterium R5-34]|uniref:DUF2059 domain-containing protein n=1 Tax=Oceaniferula flava TaxID=2800421 RepID=A0AAE2SBG9_9BACT|nr:DUF2059 domain-containing protein [Oceaniferula flavus]MBK1830002.1 DUF2059 domain-containing protein [Verrucomicrobiaceae bacterium R5-34]MBK1855151.1 DUF2059 domain-containing protein [Oceaniferula flavus]MBM1136457.1 DUF2059 domain-containing protein [Oceaniferula flavus]
MKTLLLVLASLLPLTSAMAQDKAEAQSPALQLMALINIEETMLDTSKVAFTPFLNQLKTQGFPEAGVKEVGEAADVYFQQVARDPDLKAEMVKLYEKEFTQEELSQLVDFYNSDLGKKSLEVMPALMSSGAKLGEKYAQKYAENFKVELQRIMQKYQPAGE